MIPLLKNSFGCYPLRTGALIISGLQLLFCLISGAISAVVAIGLLVVSSDHPEAFGHIFTLIFLFGIPAALVYLPVLVAVVFLFKGVNQKRPGFMVFWLVLAVLSLIGSFIGAFYHYIGVIIFVILLYCTWVIYSYYRQLKDNPESNAQAYVHVNREVITTEFPRVPPLYSFSQT